MPPEICFAFLDCEFGGLDVELHDLTEVGIILTDYRLVESAEAQWRVRARPERITAEAAKIFGYDEKLWSEAPPVRQVLSEISAMLPTDKIVVPAGQNVRMDMTFLERAYKNCELPTRSTITSSIWPPFSTRGLSSWVSALNLSRFGKPPPRPDFYTARPSDTEPWPTRVSPWKHSATILADWRPENSRRWPRLWTQRPVRPIEPGAAFESSSQLGSPFLKGTAINQSEPTRQHPPKRAPGSETDRRSEIQQNRASVFTQQNITAVTQV